MIHALRRVIVCALTLVAACSEPRSDATSDWPPPEPSPPAPRCEPLAENAWLEVESVPGPQPLVISWEDARGRRPSFVLFEDSSFLWDPFTTGEPLRRGELEAAEAAAVHRAFLEARLQDQPPVYARVADSLDHGVATHCVADEGRWVCATLDGAFVRRESLHPARAYRAGPTDGDARPTPEAFLAIQAQIDAFSERPSERFVPSSWLLELTAWRDEGRLRPAHPHPWPSALPRLELRGLPTVVVVPAENADKIMTFLGKVVGHPIHVGDEEVYVDVLGVAYPGWQTARRVRRAFGRVRCP